MKSCTGETMWNESYNDLVPGGQHVIFSGLNHVLGRLNSRVELKTASFTTLGADIERFHVLMRRWGTAKSHCWWSLPEFLMAMLVLARLMDPHTYIIPLHISAIKSRTPVSPINQITIAFWRSKSIFGFLEISYFLMRAVHFDFIAFIDRLLTRSAKIFVLIL